MWDICKLFCFEGLKLNTTRSKHNSTKSLTFGGKLGFRAFLCWKKYPTLLVVNQMLGCGAHVRIIALPHVRCACGSACGKVFGTVRAMCVRAARFWHAMCDPTFAHFLNKMTRFLVLKHPFFSKLENPFLFSNILFQFSNILTCFRTA